MKKLGKVIWVLFKTWFVVNLMIGTVVGAEYLAEQIDEYPPMTSYQECLEYCSYEVQRNLCRLIKRFTKSETE